MHIYFTLQSKGDLEIPIQYNHILQAAIYNAIEPALADFLHEKGYDSGNRKFKLFTFSRLLGKFQILKDKNTIKFTEDIKLVVSSPVEEFCQSIANGMLTKGRIKLGNSYVEVEKMLVKKFEIEKERAVLRTLSPIVVYSTLLRGDGRKYTCYYQPGEPDYDTLVENNLRKKYQAFYREEDPPGKVKVRRLGKGNMSLVYYKKTIIKGFTGKIVLFGPKELLQLAVDAGLGSKNSQGFGCLEVSY